MKPIGVAVLALTGCCAAHGASEPEYEVASPPKATVLEAAKFRWWAPAGKQVRGVLVLVPGRGGDGRGMANDAAWQELATKLNFGIMACFLKGPKSDEKVYQMDPNGSVSDLLNKALVAELAQNGQTAKNPPLVFWGHSAGGNITQHYLTHYANRVVAAVLMRCPEGPGDLAAGKGDVPALVYIGRKDKPEWVSSSLANYEKGRNAGALWTLASHPKEGHEIGNTRALTDAFITATVGLRLPGQESRPRKLNKTDAWLGDAGSLEIAEIAKFKGKKKDAAWLPNAEVARVWQEYLKR